MSFRSRLRSQSVQALLGDGSRAARQIGAEMKRRVTGGAHEVSVFLQVDDPHSYLLSHYLPFIADEYNVVFRFHVTQAITDRYQSEPELQAEYALTDARLTAGELGIPFLDRGDTPVVEHRRALLEMLVDSEGSEDFPALLFATLAGYWRGDVEGIGRMLEGQNADAGLARTVIEDNQRKLEALGHYSSATLYFGGHWYWGVDRLPHFFTRLDELGAHRQPSLGPELASIDQAMRLALPATAPARAKSLPALEFYFALDSAYSYLALQRTFAIADAWGLSLALRPVLSLSARGADIPAAMRKYAAADAAREAGRFDIPFETCDPPPAGAARRCMAILPYADSERKSREFIQSVAEGFWVDGADLSTEDGLRSVTERAGLFWPDVVASLADDGWTSAADENHASLREAGGWSVPAFRFGALLLSGQDRLWLLARMIEDRCQDGEGIMV